MTRKLVDVCAICGQHVKRGERTRLNLLREQRGHRKYYESHNKSAIICNACADELEWLTSIGVDAE